MNVRHVSLAAIVVVSGAACAPSAAAPSPFRSASPSPIASVAAPTQRSTGTPNATPSPVATPSNGVVVTFQVVAERYRILLTDPADVAIANQLLAGEEAPTIPSGRIIRGETGVNEGYSWSIDPESVEFADVTIEVCDGLPSHVEDGTLTGDQFCPWSAEVVDITPAP